MSKVFIEESTLSAIGNAIREKTGKSDLIGPLNMATEIASITTGGGSGGDLPEEAFLITGDCEHRFANNGWNWFVEGYGNRVTTNNITNCNTMFSGSRELTKIPFEINCGDVTAMSCANIFSYCTKITSVPKINNCKVGSLTGMFQGCNSLRNIPEDIESWFDWSSIDNNSTSAGAYRFTQCYSLRSVPMDFLNHEQQTKTSATSSIYRSLFSDCYTLDEIVGLPVHYRDKGITSNFFSLTFQNCHRLKNFTFAVQEDGTPYTAKWKNQTIDLTTYVGYTYTLSNITGYNSGITTDKRVDSQETYAALKNDPDWWTSAIAYCRYDHDSAVATINSLPDTSAYGTNTIKFKSGGSYYTDGGPIENLTDEEIAVAAAKGWTVTYQYKGGSQWKF